MGKYDIKLDMIEIISGTDNRTSPVYTEAASAINSTVENKQASKYFRNIMNSIEKMASKKGVMDKRISDSKGDIENFNGYDNIKDSIDFLTNKIGIKNNNMKDLEAIFKSLYGNKSLYTDGYSRNIRLIVLEYETTVYMLVVGLSYMMASYVEITIDGSNKIVEKKDNSSTSGLITKIISKLAKEVNSKSHKDYLTSLVDVERNLPVDPEIKPMEESTFDNITTTMDLFDSIMRGTGRILNFIKGTIIRVKNSLFGIIPIIRAVLYLKYKRKADAILKLEEQIHFVKMNIEQLENIKGMDEKAKAEIIKKQKAQIEMWAKRSAKLRAELIENENEASVAIKKDDSELKKDVEGNVPDFSLD